MDQWASRRKHLYLLGIIVFLTTISFFVFWQFWYQVPTCFDNIKNSDELGVDCGGACSLICNASTVKPIVRWDPRLLEASPGLWSILMYVENPNIDAVATYFPYTFTIYDQDNNVLVVREGATILPSNKTVGIFEGGITVKEGLKPRRVTFDFGDGIIWEKTKGLEPEITLTHSPILRLDSTPRIEAKVKNDGLEDIRNIELVVAVFDGDDNVIAASRTFVEKLKKNDNADVFFTWPKPFKLGSQACEKPSNVVLLLDRSGSMSSLGTNPPQPLTDAKVAAASFIKRLTAKDRVGVVSFATNSYNPIDLNLTNDFILAQKAIESVNIESSSTQYTNIYEALHSARQELVSARVLDDASKIIILLTDGVATRPTNPEGGTEEDDIKYAESLALSESLNGKKDGLTIYTIGLGQNIKDTFLQRIASGEDRYFFAPGADKLDAIYKNISSEICEEVPARVEITYKIFGQSI